MTHSIEKILPKSKTIRITLALAVMVGAGTLAGLGRNSAGDAEYFHLRLRTSAQAFKNTKTWQEAYFEKSFEPRKTAILITDMWDKHWCKATTRRVNLLAAKIEPVVVAARAAGIQIIHSPSETMKSYKNYPEREVMIQQPLVKPPASLGLSAPPLPIDDSDGGCDTPGDFAHPVWTRENFRIHIEKGDVISDNGEQVYSFLKSRGITTVFYAGVAVNMCILDRSFGIKNLTNWGVQCVLLRDLTDSMYNPKDRPYVSHAEGTALVVKHIERYWCPTAESSALVKALKQMESGGAGR